MIKRSVLISGLLLLSQVACDGTMRSATLPVVRDSASITIVDNFAPAWGERPRWRLSDEPAVAIGLTEGAAEYQFHQIMGVVRLENGSIAVAEMGSNQLRLYDAHGRHLWSAGGSGAGPGEIRQVFGLLRLGRDTLLVPDAMRPIHFFSADGAYLHTFQFPEEHGLFARPLGVLFDGSLLFATSSPTPPRITEPVQLPMLVFRSDPASGATDSIATLASVVLYPGPLEPSTQIFGPMLRLAAVADGLYTGYSDQFAVQKLDAFGNVTRIIRRPWTSTPVSSELIQRYRARFIGMEGEGGGGVPEQLREQRRRIFESRPVAATLPAFTTLLADRAGNLWARETDPEHLLPVDGGFNPVHSVPSRWSIFDTEGTWLGTVETPANFLVFEIGDDFVAGLGRDDLGVERVLVYNLRK